MNRAATAAALVLAAIALGQATGAAARMATFTGAWRRSSPRYPRKTPDWSNARYRRAARKARAVARNRRAQR